MGRREGPGFSIVPHSDWMEKGESGSLTLVEELSAKKRTH